MLKQLANTIELTDADRARLFNCCTNRDEPDWAQFARLEIGGCVSEPCPTGRFPDATMIVGGKSVDEAEFFTIYAVNAEGDREVITDCATLEDATNIGDELAQRSNLQISEYRLQHEVEDVAPCM